MKNERDSQDDCLINNNCLETTIEKDNYSTMPFLQ